jgi:hypothetical protein
MNEETGTVDETLCNYMMKGRKCMTMETNASKCELFMSNEGRRCMTEESGK